MFIFKYIGVVGSQFMINSGVNEEIHTAFTTRLCEHIGELRNKIFIMDNAKYQISKFSLQKLTSLGIIILFLPPRR